MVPFSATPTSISVVVNFKSKVIPASHPNFEKIRDMLFSYKATEADLLPLIDIPAAIETFKSENIKVIGDNLFYKGFKIDSNLAKVILGFVNKGQLEAAEPYKNFLERAQMNPDPRAVSDLYEWVAAANLPITPDGCILAWKAVQADYYSIHSGRRGKLFHGIGHTVSEPREETDPNPDVTCSRGLHFCSAPYLRFYQRGGVRIIAVKIDPANVVAFPKDYNNEKGRACEYTVVGEVEDRAKVAEFYPQGRAVYRGFDTPKPKSTIEVGDVWVTRDGKKIKIVRIERDEFNHFYPVRGDNGYAYTKTGRFLSDSEQSPNDLVRSI